jgi:hypothetical protein
MPALDIKRVRSLLPVVAAWCLLGLSSSGIGQDTDDQSLSSESPSQLEQHRHVPFGSADEFALGTTLDYYEPEPGFNRQNRDIDLQVASMVLAAHMEHGWEFQFNGVALRAHGYRTPPSGLRPEIASDAAALGGGSVARWNFLQFSRLRSFVEAEGDFLLFDRPWPTLGTVNDFFLRAGGGVSVKLTDSYWIEPRFLFAHISNGECFCAKNPAWNGRGLSLGIRRTLDHSPEVRQTRGRCPFRNADENAWMTSLEDYTPAQGLDRRSGNLAADMRELRISRAWHFPDHLEFQLGGMVQSGNTTAGFGPVLRWNLIEREHWRLFTAGGFDLLQSGSPAYIIPWRSVGYNFYPRGNVGTGFRISDSYWMDASFGWAHVTSGFAGSNQLLPWSGQGVSVALRHTFGTRRAPRLNRKQQADPSGGVLQLAICAGAEVKSRGGATV